MSALTYPEAVALAEEALRVQSAGDPAAAAALYRRALEVLSVVPEVHNNLALCELALGRLPTAEVALRCAVALRPSYAEAHNNLGLLLQKMGRADEAEEAFAAALAANPAYAHALFNLGVLRLEAGRAPEAAADFERALALAGNAFPKAAMNLGLARLEQGDVQGALHAYAAARILDPDDVEIASNQALARLTAGDWERGWQEYEARWGLPGHAPLAFPMPRWEGQDPSGKKILLWTEQGAGTSIQFLRYAPLLAARGAAVTVACEEPLRRLAAAAAGVAAVVPREAGIAGHDFHLPLVSAAGLFGTRPHAVPPPALFTLPPAPARTGKRRIALAWSGNPNFLHNARRRVPLEALAPLAAAVGDKASWHPFQQGEADLAAWPSLEAPPQFTDFYETALALREVDLVVTSDTALAHLAGSLGVPTALLLMFAPDWRWLRGEAFEARTPWYPSVRLFRQRAAGEWSAPVAALAAALAAWEGGPLPL